MRICLIIFVSYVLDLILGDPNWLIKITSHPAIVIGKIISKSEKIIRNILPKTKTWERIGGFILVITVIILSAVPVWALLFVLYKINYYLGLVIEIFICYQLLAVKSLKTESMKVYYALKNEGIESGRKMVSYIVGRDTQSLSEEGVIKAAVETVAENTTDGVVSPLFYMIFGGAVGAAIYKAINTMDSMVGYKNDKYIYFGTCAARLDDLANYIPSRICAIFMIISSFICRFNYKNAFKIWNRDRHNHKSPNAAQTESVCAGALEVQLAGNAFYFGKLYEKKTIGDKIRNIDADDIKKANKLMYGTSLIMAIFCFVISVIIY